MSSAKTTIKLAALIALAVTLLTGCMSFNPKSLRSMETALMESNPDLRIESSMHFGVGALTMDLVDFVFVHDSSIDVSKISRADIGIYDLSSTLVVDEFAMPRDFSPDSSCPLRQVIVRVVEEDEHTEIAVCIREEKVTGFTVFVLAPNEIVVVNTQGDFESLINSAIKGSTNRKPRDAETQANTSAVQSPTVAERGADGSLPPS